MVSTAAFEFMPVVVQVPEMTQRYWLLFIPAVTAVNESDEVVTAGTILFQVVPPSVLNCQLYVGLVPEATAVKLALLPVHTDAFAGCVETVMALFTVNTAAEVGKPAGVHAPVPFTTQRYW